RGFGRGRGRGFGSGRGLGSGLGLGLGLGPGLGLRRWFGPPTRPRVLVPPPRPHQPRAPPARGAVQEVRGWGPGSPIRGGSGGHVDC
ncbi:MAG TPA: hypothetical protein DEF51_49235, partial [Myxococcales bacterium]|nr:hypothetical protein [Myxococcales bacterium]